MFYIVKENRTYDQVLGDVSEGNGDTSLVLFGKNITPNQHKIVHEFMLLDNFYVDAEVSEDGHNWSLGAYATDYSKKTGQLIMVAAAEHMWEREQIKQRIIKMDLSGTIVNGPA